MYIIESNRLINNNMSITPLKAFILIVSRSKGKY